MCAALEGLLGARDGIRGAIESLSDQVKVAVVGLASTSTTAVGGLARSALFFKSRLLVVGRMQVAAMIGRLRSLNTRASDRLARIQESFRRLGERGLRLLCAALEGLLEARDGIRGAIESLSDKLAMGQEPTRRRGVREGYPRRVEAAAARGRRGLRLGLHRDESPALSRPEGPARVHRYGAGGQGRRRRPTARVRSRRTSAPAPCPAAARRCGTAARPRRAASLLGGQQKRPPGGQQRRHRLHRGRHRRRPTRCVRRVRSAWDVGTCPPSPRVPAGGRPAGFDRCPRPVPPAGPSPGKSCLVFSGLKDLALYSVKGTLVSLASIRRLQAMSLNPG